MSIFSDLLEKLRKPKNEPERHYRYEKEHFGIPSNIALTLIDESLTADEIRVSSFCSREQLKGYCRTLYEASEISKERYEDIIGEVPNLPAIPLTEDKKPSQ
jgi:hypothetical protein